MVNQTPIDSLSVFFPTYNEEENLKTTVSKAVEVLEKLVPKWEIIIINDGSTDGTGEVAKNLAKNDKRIRVISHEVNKGYGEALKSGFYNARYNTIAYNDSDGQFDFSEITKFIDKLDDSDLIIGYRIKRADPLFRLLFGKGWALSLFLFFGLKLHDVDCGFKMVRKKVIEKIPRLQSSRGGMINAELAIKAKKSGFRLSEVGVTHHPRRAGKPTGASVRVIIRSYVDLVKLRWRFLDKIEFFALVGILAVAAFLRLYKIDQYMLFLGDEGRDAIVVRRLLVNFDPILIGPGTSIGNMYLGPLYYYLMAPVMALFRLSPVGPAVQIAVFGFVTVWFVWWISREWFGKTAATVAASLYAISPVVITYSRSSWNPNIMPLFALISIYSIWRVWKHNEWKWLIVLGISYAFVLQSHYLGLLLLPTIVLFWLLAIKSVWNNLAKRNYSIRHTFYSVLIFLLLMSPLVIFDARHGWRNFEALKLFFTERQTTVSARPWNALPEIWPLWEDKFITRLVSGMNEQVGVIVAVLLATGVLWYIFIQRESLLRIIRVRSVPKSPSLLLFAWLFVGLLGLGLYKQHIYDHYFGFMFPAPFLLLGFIVQLVSDAKYQAVRFLILGGVVFLIWVNLVEIPIKYPPNRQLQRTEEIAAKIGQEAGDKPLNIAVLAERNYDDGYQYFLEWWKKPVVEIDPLRSSETITEQLFVICELPKKEDCKPTTNPKTEIANFGWSKIEGEWDVAGVRLYKLGHNFQ